MTAASHAMSEAHSGWLRRMCSALLWTKAQRIRARQRLRRQSVSSILTTAVLWLGSILVCALSIPALAAAAAPSAAASSSPVSLPAANDDSLLSLPIIDAAGCYGVFELQGRRTAMEDTHAIYAPPQLYLSKLAAQSPFAGEANTSHSHSHSSQWVSFAVFDGHGGQGASTFSATRLLPVIHATIDLAELRTPALAAPQLAVCAATDADTNTGFDALVSQSRNMSDAFTSSFLWLDETYKTHPLASHQLSPMMGDGSTAIVATVNRVDGRIIVANAGDCRALLIRHSNEPPSPCSANSITLSGYETDTNSDSDADTDSETENDGDVEDNDDLDGDVEDEKTFAINEAELASMFSHFYPSFGSLADPTMQPWRRRFRSQSQAPVAAPVLVKDDGSYEPLSLDAKPHLPHEHDYITSLPDGHVTRASSHSVSRVQGILATSRAIGDYELKPYVRSEPHIVHYQFNPRSSSTPSLSQSRSQSMWFDRWLLLASDGFFDVFTNAAVSKLVRVMAAKSLSIQEMARQLTIAAYQKGSFDNITVMLIDLPCLTQSQPQPTSPGSDAPPHPQCVMASM